MIIKVKNLTYKATETEVREWFASYAPEAVTLEMVPHDNGKKSHYAYVEIPDSGLAHKAIRDMNGHEKGGRIIYLDKYTGLLPSAAAGNDPEPPAASLPPQSPRKRGEAHPPCLRGGEGWGSTCEQQDNTPRCSPYRFVRRPPFERPMVSRLHDRLAEGCYDIAFEVTWTALTPLAPNPCKAPGPDTSPENTQKKYQGYSNRWLMIDNRLAISPFTVKSAVANGFAALMGSCYRVMKHKIVGHKRVANEEIKEDESTYPYNGKWKRYRVNRSCSKPGLLKDIDFTKGEVVVEAVEEYYCDFEPAGGVPILLT